MNMNEKILVIHPVDPTTEFLSIIYRNLNAMVIRQPISKSRLKVLIKDADRVIMLGHGTANGMGSVDYRNGRAVSITTIIDSNLVYLLREKKDNIYIWCHANEFVEKYGLGGFSTGMFISETLEATVYGVKATEDEVKESNSDFARIIRNNIYRSGSELKNIVQEDYELDSDVVRYNHERMYHFKKLES